jgi:acetoin utilization protein AcuC
MTSPAVFIGNEIYRLSSYGSRHPLAIPRVSTATDLSRAMGWLPDQAFLESPMAGAEELARFHDPAFVAAVHGAEAEQRIDPEAGALYNLGRIDNPIFPEMYRRPATSVGGALLAADLLLAGSARIAYSPASGTHHAHPARASGFCYFNAPVLGILRLLDRGVRRVLYVDLDAHHSDGVEAAFAGDGRVLMISVHEDGLWPRTGKVEDRAGGSARNLPVPRGFNDTEMAYLMEAAILPLSRAFEAEVLVLQTGADALADDPLSKLELSNLALWDAVRSLAGVAPRLLVVGGGGYNPWSVGRCWAGIWALLNGLDPAAVPTAEAEAVLRALTWNRAAGRNPPERWFTTMADPPNHGFVRDEVKRVADAAMEGGVP